MEINYTDSAIILIECQGNDLTRPSDVLKWMEALVERYNGFEELGNAVTYIYNGLGSWYTCVLHPGMEPTNNLGGQAMREHAAILKIIGCFRSENGAENYQYIASLMASWNLQDKNMFKKLEMLVRRELCL